MGIISSKGFEDGQPASVRGALNVARRLIKARLHDPDLIYLDGAFVYPAKGCGWKEVGEGDIRSEVWLFLEQMHSATNGRIAPFVPRKEHVDDIVDALKAILTVTVWDVRLGARRSKFTETGAA